MKTNNQNDTDVRANDASFQRVVFSGEASERLLEGATILAKAVGSTIGPCGHSVIIENTSGAPTITKDGVTVARSINLKESLPAMGAELLKEVANKTNDLAGDGTSTATILAHALLRDGNKMVAAGHSSIFLKIGMDLACKHILAFLKENKIPMSTEQEVINVATISANGDREIGILIADAIKQVGADGLIAIEPAKSVKTSLRLAEGIQLESGFISPFFVTNNEKQTCELENPYILITANKISGLSDILPLLEQIDASHRPLLIVADDVEGEALHTLVVNKVKGVIKVCAIKAPGYGEFRADILADFGIVAGGGVLGATSELSLKKVKLENLGQCKKAIINRTGCTIIVDEKNEKIKTAIKERADSIRHALANDGALDELRVSKYRQRLAKLSGGVAIIQVGGSTEVEILEKKDRVEDAVNATQAAAQEGIVPGGGTALFYAAQDLRNMLRTGLLRNDSFGDLLSEDTAAGVQLVANAAEEPFRVIIENSGESSEVVANRLNQNWSGVKKFWIDVENLSVSDVNDLVKQIQNQNHTPAVATSGVDLTLNKKLCFGYNVSTKKYGDLLEFGIIDPVKVTRYAMEHAVSVIGLMLTCNAVIINK